jgi:beta-lactamase regulating signal transducer with metallopeptidase domain
MMTIAPWLEALLLASLKGSILLIAALTAVRCMRRASAESRHAVLALGLAAFLLLPIAEAIAPRWTVPALPPTVIPLAGDRAVATQGPSTPAPRSPAEPRSGSDQRSAADPLALGMTPPAESAPSWRDRIDIPVMLAGLWIAGMLAVVLRLLVGITRLRALSRRATMVTDGGWLQTAHALARRLGLTRGVTLLRGDRESVPMTWGVLSPVVWLPPTADHWPSDLRSAVLSHELAHVRRRDAMTQWLANAVVAVHWFNPLVWITAGALRAERERACDDAVLALGIEADDYAAQLLDMVRTLGNSGGPATAMAMARRSQFEGRLLAILDRTISRAPVGSARVAGLAGMAVVLVLVLGGMRAASSASPASPKYDIAGAIALPPSRVAPTAEPGAQRSRERLSSPSVGKPAAALRGGLGFDSARGASTTLTTEGAGSGAKSDTPRPDTTVPASPSLLSVPALERGVPAAPAALLDALQGATRRDTTLMLEIIAAAEGISSSSDRVAVLERMAKRPDLETEVVAALGAAAGRVSSTTERSRLLKTLIQTQLHAIGSARRPVLAAIGGVASSTDQAALLMAFIARPNLTDDALADALTTSEKIASSTEKARTLVSAARLRRIEGDVRASYLRSARSITSDSERARALTALVDGPNSGDAEPSSTTPANRAAPAASTPPPVSGIPAAPRGGAPPIS